MSLGGEGSAPICARARASARAHQAPTNANTAPPLSSPLLTDRPSFTRSLVARSRSLHTLLPSFSAAAQAHFVAESARFAAEREAWDEQHEELAFALRASEDRVAALAARTAK